MLIQFDHLTLVVNRKDTQKIISEYERLGYCLSLCDDNALNIQPKLQFMNYRDKTHGLYLMKAPNGGGIPIEIIAYDHTTSNKNWINYSPLSNTFVVSIGDICNCKRLFLASGCEEKDNVIYVKGALDSKPFQINFVLDKSTSMNLDNEGFCCPTLYVTPGNKTRMKLEQSGFECTEPSLFVTNGKSMYIFFAIGKSGELIEFITNKL